MNIDEMVVDTLLPKCYEIIDKLLDGKPSKELIIEARRILPKQYRHSFEAKK